MPEVRIRTSRKYNPNLAKELKEAVEDILEGRTIELEEFLKKLRESR